MGSIFKYLMIGKNRNIIMLLKFKLVWGYSSVGRASALQAEGREFKSL